MARTRRVGGLCLVVLTALAMVAVPVHPAGADHVPTPPGPVAGAGELRGTELVLEENFTPPACFFTTRVVYGLGGEGTYKGRTAGGQEVVYRAQLDEDEGTHEGPLRLEVEASQPFYHGPEGTHGSDACTPATAGTPIPAQFRLFAADHVYRLDGAGAQAPCIGQGSFVRKSQRGNWHADWTLDHDCVVIGNEAGTPGQGVAPAGTAHAHVGFHAPCSEVCTQNLYVDYKQYLPVGGLAVVLGGPSSAFLGDVVTMTAGVTDDGLPVVGAVVAFSVDGPAPAEPPRGSAAAGTDGRATFRFTATVPGEYTVTASATSAARPGQIVSASRSVRFSTRPATMTLSGPASSQTEEPMTLRATVVRKGTSVGGVPAEPVPGVVVHFAASGAGTATPAEGTGVTNTAGQALFTFSVDRAGDYTVTARASDGTDEISATHTVRPRINTLKHVGRLDLPADEDGLEAAVIDPSGESAYFATTLLPAKVVKVDLRTLRQTGAISLSAADEREFASAVIDPAGDYAYFGTGNTLRSVVKVDLRRFERVGALTLGEGETGLEAAIIDPGGRYAYFGTKTQPGRVVKVDLASFERVDALTLNTGENEIESAVIDPAGRYAYFAFYDGGGRVAKVDLSNFRRVEVTPIVPGGSAMTPAAVIDPAAAYAYFGGQNGQLAKLDLNTFQWSGSLALPPPVSGVIRPGGTKAYFGSTGCASPVNPCSPSVTDVDLDTFTRGHAVTLDSPGDHLASAVLHRDGGAAYFGTEPAGSHWGPDGRNGTPDDPASKVLKVTLTRPPKAALAASDDTFVTPHATPLSVPAPGVLGNDADTEDEDPLGATLETKPAHGSVTLLHDGSFTYTPGAGFSGTDTFTYVADDAMDYSAPATVTIEVAAPP